MKFIAATLAIVVSIALPTVVFWWSVIQLFGIHLNIFGLAGLLLSIIIIKNLFFSEKGL